VLRFQRAHRSSICLPPKSVKSQVSDLPPKISWCINWDERCVYSSSLQKNKEEPPKSDKDFQSTIKKFKK